MNELVAKQKLLPISIKRLFGCMNCPKRSTMDCPEYDLEKQVMNIPKAGICDERVIWLVSHVPDYDGEIKPTIAQIRLDIMHSVLFNGAEKERNNLERLYKAYAEEHDDEKKYVLEKRINRAQQQHNFTNNMIMKYLDSNVTRDTVKKVDITTRREIKPSDVSKLLEKANAIEGEIEDY